MHDISYDRLYTIYIMLIIEVHHRPTLVPRHAEIRVYLHRRVITFLEQFLRTFGGVFNAKSVGFWGSALGPAGGAYSAPPDPLAGREGPRGAPLQHPPRGGSASSFAPPPAPPSPVPPPPPPPPPPPAPNSWIHPCN